MYLIKLVFWLCNHAVCLFECMVQSPWFVLKVLLGCMNTIYNKLLLYMIVQLASMLEKLLSTAKFCMIILVVMKYMWVIRGQYTLLDVHTIH